MIYLEKLQKMEPDLRKTIACGYWTGGDDSIERVIIEESDAINVLSSDAVIKDLNRRINTYHPKIKKLFHGHKVGFAYISNKRWMDWFAIFPPLMAEPVIMSKISMYKEMPISLPLDYSKNWMNLQKGTRP